MLDQLLADHPYVALALAFAAPLALMALHTRGLKMPILEGILAVIIAKTRQPEPAKTLDPPAPAVPYHPVAQVAFEKALAKVGDRDVFGFDVPSEGKVGEVALTLYVK